MLIFPVQHWYLFHQMHDHHQSTHKTTHIDSSNLVSRYFCYCFLDEKIGLWELKSLAVFTWQSSGDWVMGMYLSDQSWVILHYAKSSFSRKHWRLVPTCLVTKKRRERWSVKRTVMSQELLSNPGFQSQFGSNRAQWFKARAPWIRQPSLTIAAPHRPAVTLGKIKTLNITFLIYKLLMLIAAFL